MPKTYITIEKKTLNHKKQGIQFLWGIISIKLKFIYKILLKLRKTQLFLV